MRKADLEKLFQENPFRSLSDAIYEVLLKDIIEFHLLPERRSTKHNLPNVSM